MPLIVERIETALAMKRDPRLFRKQLLIRVAAVATVILLVCALVEGVARLVYLFEGEMKSLVGLKMERPFVRDHGWHTLVRLEPGFTQTVQEAIESRKRAGRTLAAARLEELATEAGVPRGQVFLRINQRGFRGPEFDDAHSRPRMLIIGDSVTYGDVITYPQVMQDELRRLGYDVEVINGGVPGYAPADILQRIDEFKALRPDVTVIFTGWNALYSQRLGVARYSYSIRLASDIQYGLRVIVKGAQEAALAEYKKEKRPDRDAPAVERLDRYIPPFVDDVAKIVAEMKSAGTEVMLVTLPGLFVMDEAPTPRALEIGHLPRFTNNPFVLAKMAQRYNVALRELAERHEIQVVDLETWSRAGLQPRDAYFSDSVHLYGRGLQAVGAYLAGELAPGLKTAIERNQKQGRLWPPVSLMPSCVSVLAVESMKQRI